MSPAARNRKWLPVFFSAAVYPGAGQIFQGRWLAGFLFAVAFSAAAVWMGWLTMHPAFRNLQTAVNGMRDEFILPDWPRILASLGLCAAVYGVNLADVIRSARKDTTPKSRPESSGLPGVQD